MERKVEVYFGGELSHLFELGYISTDLHQIAAFGEMVAESRKEDIERFFLRKKPGPITRYTKFKGSKRPRTEIVDVKPGSILLLIGVSTLVAAIVMPLVAIHVNRQLERSDVAVQFNISPKDHRLKRVLDAYEVGQFGDGQKGLELMFAVISNDYDVEAVASNVYEIDHVVTNYSRRIVRTIQKHHSRGR